MCQAGSGLSDQQLWGTQGTGAGGCSLLFWALNGQKKVSNTADTPAPRRRFSKPSEFHIEVYPGLTVRENGHCCALAAGSAGRAREMAHLPLLHQKSPMKCIALNVCISFP